MNRSTKKFLYALLYIGVFFVIGFLVYFAGRLGGGKPPLPANVSPSPAFSDLLQVADGQIFRIRDASPAFLFGKVKNISHDYGFRFAYTFSLYGLDDKLLKEVQGEASVSPASETLLYETADDIFSRDVQGVGLQVRVIQEVSVYEFPALSLSFPEGPRIEILDEERLFRVRGTVRNESGTFIPEVRVIALLRDSFGFQVFVSGTILANLRSFSEKRFEIPVPYDADLARQAREGSVEVFFYPVL